MLGGECIGLGFAQAVGLHAGVHHVPLEQDHRAAVGGKTFAPAFHLVDGHDAGQRHAEAVGGLLQVLSFEVARGVVAVERSHCLRARNAIIYQTCAALEGNNGALGLLTEVAVHSYSEAGQRECGLQVAHGEAAGANEQEFAHSSSTFFLSTRLAASRLTSTPNRPTMQARNTPASCGAPISDGP